MMCRRYWGQDLDLSGSRDVIGHVSGSRDVIDHVTIRIPMGHFLLVVHWTQVFISSRFRDIWP